MRIYELDQNNPDREALYEIATILKGGGIVALPTETVYGLAVCVDIPEAVERLRQIKNRPENKPFPVQIWPTKKLFSLTPKDRIAPNAYRLIQRFWPGPLTVILPAIDTERFGEKVGIRVSAHKVVQELLGLGDLVVYMPSANPSGSPPALSLQDVISYFPKGLDAVVASGGVEGIASTVVDITVSPWKILREGAIPPQEIRRIEQGKRIVFVCTGNSCRSVMAEYYLKKLLSQREGAEEVEVYSCGIMVVDGIGGATPVVVEMLAKEGMDASKHIRRAINESLLLGADLIFVMERYHEDVILRYLPFLRGRIYLLGEFIEDLSTDPEIPDPIGGNWEVYEETYSKIKKAVNRIIDLITGGKK